MTPAAMAWSVDYSEGTTVRLRCGSPALGAIVVFRNVFAVFYLELDGLIEWGLIAHDGHRHESIDSAEKLVSKARPGEPLTFDRSAVAHLL